MCRQSSVCVRKIVLYVNVCIKFVEFKFARAVFLIIKCDTNNTSLNISTINMQTKRNSAILLAPKKNRQQNNEHTEIIRLKIRWHLFAYSFLFASIHILMQRTAKKTCCVLFYFHNAKAKDLWPQRSLVKLNKFLLAPTKMIDSHFRHFIRRSSKDQLYKILFLMRSSCKYSLV